MASAAFSSIVNATDNTTFLNDSKLQSILKTALQGTYGHYEFAIKTGAYAATATNLWLQITDTTDILTSGTGTSYNRFNVEYLDAANGFKFTWNQLTAVNPGDGSLALQITATPTFGSHTIASGVGNFDLSSDVVETNFRIFRNDHIAVPNTASETISLRNGTYKWTDSPTTPNEYYVDLFGGGDPSLNEPSSLTLNGVEITKGTLGSLAAATWGWGNQDSLGYETVYLRLADSTDPDLQAVDYVQAVIPIRQLPRWVNPLTSPHNAVGDGSNDDRTELLSADTTAGVSGVTYIEAGKTFLIGTEAAAPTFASTFMIDPGGLIKVANTVTVTFNKPPIAGPYQIFDLSLGGSVTLPDDCIAPIQWFGVDNDGIVDNEAVLQKAVDSGAGEIQVRGGGTYLSNGTIDLPSNLKITGDGVTIIKHKPTDDGAGGLFDLNAKSQVTLENLKLQGGKTGKTVNSSNASIVTIRGGQHITVRDCHFLEAHNCAILITDDASLNPAEDVAVIGNFAEHCGGDADPGAGSNLWGAYAVTAGKRISFIDNKAEGDVADPGSYLIDLEPNNVNEVIEDVVLIGNQGIDTGNITLVGDGATQINIKGITVSSNVESGTAGGGGGNKIQYAENVTWIGNVNRVNNSDQGMILNETNQVVIEGCVIDRFGRAVGSTNYGIHIQDNCVNTVIGDMYIDANDFVEGGVRYGIFESGAGNTTHVTGIIRTTNITAGNEISISDAGGSRIHQGWGVAGRLLSNAFRMAQADDSAPQLQFDWSSGLLDIVAGGGGEFRIQPDAIVLETRTGTMVGNETFLPYRGTFHRKNLLATDRTFNPSGTFPGGSIVFVQNTSNPPFTRDGVGALIGGGVLTVDSTTLAAKVLPANQVRPFYYDGSNWQEMELSPVQKARLAVPSVDLLDLFATPLEIIPAPGVVASATQILGISIKYTYDTTAYTIGTMGPIVLKYTNAAGATITNDILPTGFIDQPSNQYRTAMPLSDIAVASNAAIVLHCGTASPTGGVGTLSVEVIYRGINF